jgi:hypothetical protein
LYVYFPQWTRGTAHRDTVGTGFFNLGKGFGRRQNAKMKITKRTQFAVNFLTIVNHLAANPLQMQPAGVGGEINE